MQRDLKSKYCLLTNDVETTSIWFNSLRDETGLKVVKEGMPILLDLYAKYEIKSTFFFTGYIAQKYPEIVKMILPYGHEIGSHGYSHKVENAFDVLSFEKQVTYLNMSKSILEDISGESIISFRAPALRVNKFTPLALVKTGFIIDSSVPSQRFDMFLSHGNIKKIKWIFAPRKPYYTKLDNLCKKGDSTIIEVPLSATFFPYVGTTMRMFPLLTKIQRNIIHKESLYTQKPIVFDIHPNEFIDESNIKRIISRRSNNYISYLMADLIRSKLKIKNLGPKAIILYEDEILFYFKRNYKFTTLKDYCRESGFNV